MKPRSGEVKLKTDGSRAGDPPTAGFGGLLRDHMGTWLRGYSGKLGNHSVLYAELHSIKTGLLMAWMMGFRNVWCESDSLHALQLISSRQHLCFHTYATVITGIKELLARNWNVRLSHFGVRGIVVLMG